MKTVRAVLEERGPGRICERDVYRGRTLFFAQKKGARRVLTDAGSRAVLDLVKKAPALALMHLTKEFRGKKLEE